MSASADMNAPGSGYPDHPNPFEILCLDPRDPHLTLRAVRLHHRVVLKHVFERGVVKAKTLGRFVATWSQSQRCKRAVDQEVRLLRASLPKLHASEVERFHAYDLRRRDSSIVYVHWFELIATV